MIRAAKRDLRYRFRVIFRPAALIVIAATAVSGATTTTRQTAAKSQVLPTVVAADVPQYPREAADGGVGGTLPITVTTDGQRVTSVRVISRSANSLLGDAALRNVNTWRFAPHAATTFDTTFKYTIVDRQCSSLGLNTHAAAVIQFPTQVEVFAERDPSCPGATRPTPVFGIYMHRASIPFFPSAARAKGIDGKVTIGVTYKGVLSLVDGPEELGEPVIELIRDWMMVPGPYSEELTFTFKLVDGECRGGPQVVVGPGLTSYEVTDTKNCR